VSLTGNVTTSSSSIVDFGSGQFYKATDGNIGIGTSSPASKLSIQGDGTAFRLDGTGNTSRGILLRNTGTGEGYIETDGNMHFLQEDPSRYMRFSTANTERMRIDASGRVFINTTTNPLPNNGAGRMNMVVPSGDDGINIKHEHTGNCLNFWRTASDGPVLSFYRSNSSPQVQVGSINLTGSATSYVTSSDYRLKHDIQPMTGALAKVAQLKPVTYKWNADDSESQGFIAHELQEVVPECVTGDKDGVETYTDEEGVEQTRPKYQGIDTSFLVATLTAAIQEQQAIITALTARVEALERTQE
jgi:hypothetical protein